GHCKLEPGFAPGRTVEHWEITTHGLFSGRTFRQVLRAPQFEVARGERVTVRAVMSNVPVGDKERAAAAGRPDPRVVEALRDVVMAKERTRDTVKKQFAAARVSQTEVADAEIDLLEARIRLAEAERNKAGVCALLEDLVTQRQEQRRLTELRVK